MSLRLVLGPPPYTLFTTTPLTGTRFRQSPDTTVNDHIRLLRQYNKTKDVGQQLIGIIAESRGVSLGDVYRDGNYGVSADD